jgi:hypothetical protein
MSSSGFRVQGSDNSSRLGRFGLRLLVLSSTALPLLISGSLIYFVAPMSISPSLGNAYGALQPGSARGVTGCAQVWVFLSVLSAGYGVWRLGAQAGWSGDRAYSRGRCLRLCLFGFAFVSLTSYGPWVAISFALAHVMSDVPHMAGFQILFVCMIGVIALAGGIVLSVRNIRAELRRRTI